MEKFLQPHTFSALQISQKDRTFLAVLRSRSCRRFCFVHWPQSWSPVATSTVAAATAAATEAAAETAAETAAAASAAAGSFRLFGLGHASFPHCCS